MQAPENTRARQDDEAVVRNTVVTSEIRSDELAWHRAETERLRVLVDFLARPIHAPGGTEPDPDVLTAYNLAIEAALMGIRRGARRAILRKPGLTGIGSKSRQPAESLADV
jgi:hypothetical protein